MSSKRFKITFHRSGHQFETKYAGTAAGAMRSAHSKGFLDEVTERYPKSSSMPSNAKIFMRYQDRWELLATVNSKSVMVEDPESLSLVKLLRRSIENAQAELNFALKDVQTLNDLSTVKNFEAAIS